MSQSGIIPGSGWCRRGFVAETPDKSERLGAGAVQTPRETGGAGGGLHSGLCHWRLCLWIPQGEISWWNFVIFYLCCLVIPFYFEFCMKKLTLDFMLFKLKDK